MFVVELDRQGIFAGKIVFLKPQDAIDGARLISSGAFRYVASPVDCCPDQLLPMIWERVQANCTEGTVEQFIWHLDEQEFSRPPVLDN
jgi:hypothetical protein